MRAKGSFDDGSGIAQVVARPGAERREDRQAVRQASVDGRRTGWASTGSRRATAKSTRRRAGSSGTAEALVEAGRRLPRSPRRLGCSKATVRHWLTRYGLRTRTACGARGPKSARAAGLLNVTRTLPRHGEIEFMLEGRGYYRCKRCRSERVSPRRRKLKAILVAEAGGRAACAATTAASAALEFHHLDPAAKAAGHQRRRASPCRLRQLRAEAESACSCAPTATPKSRAVRCETSAVEFEPGSDVNCM